MTALLNNLTDLTISANAEEAWREWRRCFSDADFAAWAKSFGEPALLAVDDLRRSARTVWDD